MPEPRSNGAERTKPASAAPRTDGASAFAPTPPVIEAPSLSLPKSGGAIRGIGEKFTANQATGTASMSIPIAISPGRGGFGPQLSLSYDSGRGNGPFGFGWSLSLPAVTRRTDKGLPRYDDSDVFLLSDAEDLVPALAPTGADAAWVPVTDMSPVHAPGYRIERYRPRVEGLFARIERWIRLADGDTHWRSVTRDNVANRYGEDTNSRIADPADPARIFGWLLCRSEDGRGNVISYEYLAESGDGVDLAQAHERHRGAADRTAARYLKRIRYGNRISSLVDSDPPDPGWMFEVVFDYGDHHESVPTPAAMGPPPCRADPFSSYRAGFEVRTYRLCRRVLMFHHFPAEEGIGQDCLVGSTDLGHTPGDAVGTFLASVTKCGYRRDGDGYLVRALPPVEFAYTPARLTAEVREVDPDSVANLPAGLGGSGHQWADLDGEGISGVLVTGTDAWFYKPNLGEGRFGPIQPVPGAPVPGLAAAKVLDLAGDGTLDVVAFAGPTPGFVERTTDGGWLPWRPFATLPTVDFDDPDVRMVDLDGDGHADLLVMEDESLTWHPSRGEAGFGPGIRVTTAPDADAGPRLVFSDGTQSLHLADMTGDGLSDLVRIGNGSVCYWPNLGHGRFGAKVTMDDAPWFDRDELFDQRNLRLSDVDGSGVTDLIYLAGHAVRVYLNRSGNGWAPPVPLPGLPAADPSVTVDAVDLLGTGTACLVWSSTHAEDAGRSMRYADLMGGVKPHLLERVVNNLGADTLVRYKPSTHFYLADRAAGRPWLTRLPFPVQVVERVETYDRISRNRFVTRYAYHHGHFDGIDREFRGFGMTEQWDTEELSALGEVDLTGASNEDPVSHVPPVLTRTWFHTGAFVGSSPFAAEYWREPGPSEAERDSQLLANRSAPDTLLLADGTRLAHRPTTEELREAGRALKGSTLRQEVYGLDGSAAQDLPYRVTETTYAVELLQPIAGQPHAVCLKRPRETVTHRYERRLYAVERADGTVADLADPRVTHELTLDVDGFGNVLRGASVAYRRRHPDADLDPRLPSWAAAGLAATQAATLGLVTSNGFTNAVDEPGAYRTPMPCESRTFELVNIAATPSTLLSIDEVRALCDAAGDGAHDLPYEDVEATGAVTTAPYRRLLAHVRSLYRRDDLAGPLPLGRAEPFALPHENYTLALTAGLIASVYHDERDGAVTDLLPDAPAVLRDEGGYLPGEDHRAAGLFPPDDPDGQWWAPTGRLHCSPEAADDPAAELAHALAHFFLPARFVDPFGQVSTVHYDTHDLLVTQVRDPLDNLITAGNDYRVLAPHVVSDANGNRGAVAFDALGRQTATAFMGRPTEVLGDSLDDLTTDPDPAAVRAAVDAVDPRTAAPALLGRATSRLVYDLWRYHDTRLDEQPQPNLVWTIARETHVSDLPSGQTPRLQHTLRYSDGLEAEVLTKVGAEPGGVAGDPRWVGTGRTVFNNKGLPIKQFEPFFSATHRYEAEADVVMQGVTRFLAYDPVGRLVRTDFPDETLSRTSIEPWRQITADQNDTVLDSGWYAARGRPDPAVEPEPADPQRRAAWLAAGHADTPTVEHFDALGRPFLTVTHNRATTRDDSGAPTFTDLAIPVDTSVDIEGNLLLVTDGRGNPVMHYRYGPGGTQLHQRSLDAGQRRVLNDVTGKAVRAWDGRGHTLRTGYDALRRPVTLFVRGTDAARSHPDTVGRELLCQRTEYGEGQPDAEARNLRGRVFRVYDGAGLVTNEAVDFKGNVLRTTRRLAADYRGTPDWSTAVALEDDILTTDRGYDALNRVVRVAIPHGSGAADAIQPTYNEAGLLQRVDVWTRLPSEPTALLAPETADLHAVVNIDYDAKGQRTLIEYGSGVRTDYAYDPSTFRLTRLTTTRAIDGDLQDLTYTCDPVGNVIEIRDAAQQAIFFANTLVSPDVRYSYDALYQLTRATGREHVGQAAQTDHADSPAAPVPHPNDTQALRRYAEEYAYDPAGNIVAMIHQADGGAWTRRYEYAAEGNRLLTTSLAGDGTSGPYSARYEHDDHGNMTRMPHLPVMQWDHRNHLRATSQQVRTDGGTPETTYYQYDAGGQRVRKVTDGQAATGATPSRRTERIYPGGWEIYRDYGGDGDTVTFERDTLHLVDDRRRIALVETTTLDAASSTAEPSPLVRYQLDNHLGSACLELDGDGVVISYEEYHPYGSSAYRATAGTMAVSAKRYRYTAKERDEETGLYYHGARYYVSWLGRWSAADPAGLRDGGNLYRYVHNRPSTMVDPTGMASDNTETTVVAPLVRQVLGEYGVPYAEQVSFTYVDSSGNVIDGVFDVVFEDPNTHEPVFLELKGRDPTKRSTPGQATYMAAFETEQGGHIEFTGQRSGKLMLPTGKRFAVSSENFATVWMGNTKEFGMAVDQIHGGVPKPYFYQTPEGTTRFATQAEFDAYRAAEGIDVVPSRFPRRGSAVLGALITGGKRVVPVASVIFGLASAKANAAQGNRFDAAMDVVGAIPTPVTEAADLGRGIGEVLAAIPEDAKAFWEWHTTPPSHVDQELARMIMQEQDPGMYQDLEAGLLEWDGSQWRYANGPERP